MKRGGGGGWKWRGWWMGIGGGGGWEWRGWWIEMEGVVNGMEGVGDGSGVGGGWNGGGSGWEWRGWWMEWRG